MGPPLRVNGTYYISTSGHCGIGTWKNGNNTLTVGHTYTTSYNSTPSKSNAGKYGDFQLLAKTNTNTYYALSVFSGSASSTSTLSYTSANWQSRAQGTELCFSGQRSGQRCRQRITLSDSTFRFTDGSSLFPATEVIDDQNRDGVPDCNGIQHTDSGGPVYYGDGYGGVIAYATVTSTSLGCWDHYSQLRGIRLWNPTAILG